MRVEATVPDSRGKALDQLADELGLSRSQVIDEALAIFFQAVKAVRGGQRLVAVDPSSEAPDYVIVTPTLAALEWAARPAALNVSAEALEKVRALLAQPSPAPNEALKAAANRFKKSKRR